MVSYGSGGHYEPHVDFYEKYLDELDRGDRVATLLIYLNDVQAPGGLEFFNLMHIQTKLLHIPQLRT